MKTTTALVQPPVFSANSFGTTCQTLVVFDQRVPDLGVLQAALQPDCVTMMVAATDVNIIETITAQLAATGITRLAIVAHGEPGVLHLGAESLTLSRLEQQTGLLAEWGVTEITLYACEVGADAVFVAGLAQLTGAKVVASSQKVGAAALGGSWEISNERVSVFVAEQLADYAGVLASFTGTSGNDAANAGTGVLMGFGYGTVAELQDAVGDTFIAGTGSDTVVGGSGDDTIDGGADNDQLEGGDGADALVGGDGNDFLFDGLGTDYLFGEAGEDTLSGGADTDYLDGGVDADSIAGGDGDDTLLGQDGDDILVGEAGNDFFVAGDGADSVAGGIDGDTLLSGLGDDNLDGGDGDDALAGDAGNDILLGGLGGDRLLGGTDNDLMDGGSDIGNDQLYGEEGNDTLIGGIDSDFLSGGAGADEFVFGAADTIFEHIGLDTVADFEVGDQLVLSKATFTALTSTVGSGFSVINEFASVTINADISTALIVYNSITGDLFYNQNGSAAGFGNGGQFGLVTGAPALTALDFLIQE
jgi:Ca2+-binding RTX toxin-like protein